MCGNACLSPWWQTHCRNFFLFRASADRVNECEIEWEPKIAFLCNTSSYGRLFLLLHPRGKTITQEISGTSQLRREQKENKKTPVISDQQISIISLWAADTGWQLMIMCSCFIWKCEATFTFIHVTDTHKEAHELTHTHTHTSHKHKKHWVGVKSKSQSQEMRSGHPREREGINRERKWDDVTDRGRKPTNQVKMNRTGIFREWEVGNKLMDKERVVYNNSNNNNN